MNENEDIVTYDMQLMQFLGGNLQPQMPEKKKKRSQISNLIFLFRDQENKEKLN